MESVNSHYMTQSDTTRISDLVIARLAELGTTPTEIQKTWLAEAMPLLIERHSTINEIADNVGYFTATRPIPLDEKTGNMVTADNADLFAAIRQTVSDLDPLTEDSLSEAIKALAAEKELKMGKVAPLLRASLCGTMQAPSIFALAAILGKDECLARIDDALARIG
tara:strand:- start:1550 stop:2047 length:498 start_codon:yes stop_codon:yes gene_type:complete